MRKGLTVFLFSFGALGCGVETESALPMLPEGKLEHVFSIGDSEMSTWSSDGENPGSVPLGLVADVAITSDGGLVVLDAHGPRALRFSREGAFLGELGGRGEGPGEFSNPSGVIAVDAGPTVIWDPGLGRMSVFQEDGSFLRSWQVPEFSLSGVRVLFPAGNADVLLRVGGHGTASSLRPLPFHFLRFDLWGSVGDTLRFPGEPVEVPQIEGPIQDVVPFAAYPDWTVLQNGIIALTGRREYRVMLFGRDLAFEAEITAEFPPVPVLPDEAEAWRSTLIEVVRRRDPGWRWEGGDIPPIKPAIRTVLPADDGRLIVMPHGLAEPGPERRGRVGWIEPQVAHVYSSSGDFEVAIRLPAGSRLLRLRADRVVALSSSAVGAPQLDVYRVVLPSGGG